jgi:hypothetical protein
MTAGKTTAQVFGLFGLLATAISLGFTAADVAAQEVAPKVMTAGEAYRKNNINVASEARPGNHERLVWRPALRDFAMKHF